MGSVRANVTLATTYKRKVVRQGYAPAGARGSRVRISSAVWTWVWESRLTRLVWVGGKRGVEGVSQPRFSAWALSGQQHTQEGTQAKREDWLVSEIPK